MKRYPEIIPVALTSKDEVYSFTLPADTKSYTIKTRGNSEFKLAYKSGEIEAGNYITIPSGTAENEDNLGCETAITGYVQCEKDNEYLEVKRWR